MNPFATVKGYNLLARQELEADALRKLYDGNQADPMSPFLPFPEPNGLLVYASGDAGELFYWETIGEPDAWPTIIYEGRGPLYQRLAMPMTEILASFLTRVLPCTVMSPSVFAKPPTIKAAY